MDYTILCRFVVCWVLYTSNSDGTLMAGLNAETVYPTKRECQRAIGTVGGAKDLCLRFPAPGSVPVSRFSVQP